MAKREHVYGVLGYYDGVIDGVADFRGRPHAFVLDQDADAETPVYRLAPLSPETMSLFDEAWQIWRRWERAHPGPSAVLETVAALPQDRARHDELDPVLKQRLSVSCREPTTGAGRLRAASGCRP